MHLHCSLRPDNCKTRDSLIARLEALGEHPVEEDNGLIVLDYEGTYENHAMALIAVFESFGCNHTMMFKGSSYGNIQES